MIKRSGFLRKRDDQTVEEFRRHWLQAHAPLVRGIARPQRYVVNFVDRERHPEFPFDGFSELWFRRPSDMNVFSPGSPIKRDELLFVGGLQVVTIDERVIVEP
jgi:hypothetical protein